MAIPRSPAGNGYILLTIVDKWGNIIIDVQ
jgi:hypothetical protein